ncbi:MAG TPA: ATP-binding protein [Burkholderiales bacterium]|jgi:nitrogen fixation/metabolism regulation signal transduction histidine kinase
MSATLPPPRPALSSAIVRYLLILCVGLVAVALYLVAASSANPASFAERYPLLLALNGAVAVMLTGLVAYQFTTLMRKLKAGVFGSRLTLRLVLLFALMAVVPGALIYGMSVQFLARSIEAWFEVRLDKALDSGLNLGRGMLDGSLRELAAKAAVMARALPQAEPEEQAAALSVLREQAGVQEATLFGERGRVIAYSGPGRRGLLPELPGAAAQRQLRAGSGFGAVEAIPDKGLYLRALEPVPGPAAAPRVLQLVHPVPKQLGEDAEAVQSGYREYQELTLSRRGLKRLYRVTLTLTLLLAMLSAAALAFFLSDRLSAPIGALVEGTRAVASGDFSQRAAVVSRDEIGTLTQSFNRMTLQLAEAHAQAERHQAALSQAKAYLESVLANLSAGVLAFDEELNLRAANRSAGAILGIDFGALVGSAPEKWPATAPDAGELGREIASAFARSGAVEWEQQVERPLRGGTQLLLLRGTRLPTGSEGGGVVVFDDITHLAEAQRAEAWAEVARRLAHEIRNPLTPIQLSAERLRAKLEGKLAQADAEVLARSTQTIVNQVAALKYMVDAFSQYARTPEPTVRELDLSALTREVLTLYESSLGGAVRLELAAGLPPVLGDAAQLRQVIHNLLQNSQDALADTPEPRVTVATAAAGEIVRLTVTDNGCGVPEHVMRRAFEPYVTTKPRGTGLGLAIVKKIVEEHGGTAAIANVAPRGVCVTIQLPVAAQDTARRVATRARV